MSKNLTRKGLAFGALVALGASVIAGTPATAVTPLASSITTTYKGTGLSVVEGTDFQVATTIASDYAYYSAVGELYTATPTDQYSVCILWTEDGGGGDDADYCVDSEVQTLTLAEAAAIVHAPNDWDDAGILNRVTDRWVSTTGDLEWTSSNDDVEIDNNDSAASFYLTDIAADTAVTFTPYLDLDNDDVKDINEPSGAATVVTFLNNTGTVLTSTLTGTIDGLLTQDLKNTVTAATGVNLTQMEDDLEVVLYKSSLPVDQNSGSAGIQNQDLGDGDITTTTDSGINYWNDTATGYYTARVMDGSTAFSALSAETIVGQQSPDSKITDLEFVDVANANQTTEREVRAGVKSFEIAAQLYTEDGSDDGDSHDAYAKSGVSVKFFAELDGVAVDSVIKINDTTITDSGVYVTVPTDANGIAKVTITSNNGTDSDDIIVSATTLYSEGTLTAECVDEWSWVTAYANNLWETHNVGLSSPVLGTTRNASVTLNYEVTDNFGQPLVLAGYETQIRVVGTGIDATGPLVNGKATVTFNNQAVTGSTYTVRGYYEYRAIGSTVWSQSFDDSTTIVVNHINTVGSLSAEADLDENGITFSDFVTLNWDLIDSENTTASDPQELDDNEIQGTVVDSNNVPLAGVAVTVSASGVQFTDEDLYTVGSITVYTDENGFYEVEFMTHKAGDNLFTVTSGGKSATVTVDIENPFALHASDVLTVAAPAAVQAGTVTPVNVKLFDKYGNGIDGATVNLGLVGEGYLSEYEVVTSNGAASVVLINGVNDTSVAYISAATEHAEWAGIVPALTGAEQNFVNKTFTQKVTTGSVATVKAGKVKGRLLVDVDNSRNETVRVFVNGKLVKKMVANSHHALIKINGLPKGKHKVTVTSDYQNLVTKAPVTIK